MPEAALQKSELVFVGFGIVAPEYGWNDYGIDVRGKTVLVLAGDPGYASKDPSRLQGQRVSLYGRWDYKMEEAARHGAAGVLLIHDAAALGLRLGRGGEHVRRRAVRARRRAGDAESAWRAG